MTMQLYEQMAPADGYIQPRVQKDSGPPRAIYLAPVYSYQGKQRLIVGERLTSMENPLSADPRDQARYLSKGFKVATKADIQRLSPLEGKMAMFDHPLESIEQLGIKPPKDTKAEYLEAQNVALQQKIDAMEAEAAAKEVANKTRRDNLEKARAALKGGKPKQAVPA